MSSKKKVEAPIIIEEDAIIPEDEAKKLAPEEIAEVTAPKVEIKEIKETKEIKPVEKKKETKSQAPKYAIGSIVFISKDADADLNGFKLFPQYKKYTYTVEAYNSISGVYSLRRLNLSLKLKEDLILAPNERAHDALNKKQF